MLDVDPSWRNGIESAYEALDPAYRQWLEGADRIIPEKKRLFNAFKTLPRQDVRYVLFGQDPYPRAASATGHAFIDGAVDEIFSSQGLSKAVNRATSLRNFIKMALVCEGLLSPHDLSQEAITAIDKRGLIRTIHDLRRNFEKNGVLLLNASLVFEEKQRCRYHAKAWRPFVRSILVALESKTELILFGGIAKEIGKLPEAKRFAHHMLEHPYNHSFVLNEKAYRLFGPMHLLHI